MILSGMNITTGAELWNNIAIDKLLFWGGFTGFFIALPFGINAVLCIKNTLSYGGRAGIVTGFGAATAHTFYTGLGLSGLFAVKLWLDRYLGGLEILGGLFLCYFGILSIRKEIAAIEGENGDNPGLLSTYSAATLVALTNPKSIIVAAILITESGMMETVDYSNVLALAILLFGVFLGSTLWWIVLVTVLGLLKQMLNPRYLTLLNRASGVIVIGFGLFFAGLGLQKTWIF